MGRFGRRHLYAVSFLAFAGGAGILTAEIAAGPRTALAASATAASLGTVSTMRPSGIRPALFSVLPLSLPVQAPAGDIPLPDGKGKDLTKRLCSACHSSNVWAAQRHTREKWGSIIDNMLSKGLEASDDDLAIVNDYLVTNFGPASTDAPAAPPPAAPPQH
jgi:cytochrome c5